MRILLFFCLFFLYHSSCLSQDWPTVERNGEKYYRYRVESGNTLYGISKSFLVEVEDLIRANPGVESGLQVGQEILVPINRENKKIKADEAPILQNDRLLHTVSKGQTLYSIARSYGLTQEEILKANPAIRDGLKEGAVLVIPLKKPEVVSSGSDSVWLKHRVVKGDTYYSLSRRYKVTADSIQIVNNGLPQGLKENELINIPILIGPGDQSESDTLYGFIRNALRKDSVIVRKIALLLPFFTERNVLRDESEQSSEDSEIYGPSEVGISFYNGFKLAIDSLWKDDSLVVYVYDTANDTTKVKRILKRPELREVDLIIGPIYSSAFSIVSAHSNKYQIPLLSPFTQTTNIIEGNPWVIKFSPSQEALIAGMSEQLPRLYPGSVNYILLNTTSLRDRELALYLKNSLPPGIKVKEASSVKALQPLLEIGRKNVVLFPSQERSQVTDYLTKLNFIDGYDIEVVGLDAWLSYDNLDAEYLENLKIVIAAPGFADFDDDSSKTLVAQYREEYQLDANQFVFKGVDAAHFANVLLKSTEWFNLADLSLQGKHNSYTFTKAGPDDGFENRSFRLLRFEGYRYVRFNGF